MPQTTVQFISQVKLGELRRQRGLLLDAYDRLTANATFRSLYDGLRAIKVAGRPMHPDLANLDFLLADGAAPETAAFWRGRVEAEAATGRLRADIVYLFGALLGEWGADADSSEAIRAARAEAHVKLLEQARTPAVDTGHEALFDEVLAGLADRIPEARAEIAGSVARWLELGAGVDPRIGDLANNIYQPAALRQEAKRIAADPVLAAEYAGALGVLARDPANWAWPPEGVPTRAVWTRNKWRLYPDLTLVQCGIQTAFGRLWADAIEEPFTDVARLLERMARLHKLIDLNAPDVITQNERRMLKKAEEGIDLGWYEPVDPWDGTSPVPREEEGFAAGIASRRAGEQAQLRIPHAGGYYDGGYATNRVVRLVNAEVRTLRAAYPDTPLFVVTFDIANYFPSLPHDVLLAMVRRLGLADAGLAAVRRFLAVPHLVDGQVVPAARGVPMNQDLSHFLAEWLLRLMERYIHQRARVRIIRQLDDVCLMAPDAAQIVAAWAAARTFLGACGLSANAEKSGSLAIGADLPTGLPAGAARWGMLELTPDAEWGVHAETFRTFLEETQKHVAARPALLGRVTLYNAHLQFLTTALGLALDLGDAHRAAVGAALRRFEAEAFGPGAGVVAGLRAGIAERYLQGTSLGHLPESWMYWPITAGGLSLRSVLVLEGQYRRAIEDRREERVDVPDDRPEGWQHGTEDWTAYYEDQLGAVEPAKPTESKVMKTLVDDFIARGAEISGGKQATLSDYWRWVLCLYGPEVLEKFGTFRFLLTDLVPLQLIHEQLLQDSSLEG